jgi:hypothetical protein
VRVGVMVVVVPVQTQLSYLRTASPRRTRDAFVYQLHAVSILPGKRATVLLWYEVYCALKSIWT